MTIVAIKNKDGDITTGKLLDAPYGIDEGELVIIEGKDEGGNKFQTEGRLVEVLED